MSWSGFKKNVGRATTQVMMKTGHVEKTSDREYEVEERRFRTLEAAALRLQKEAKAYLDSLRAMTASQMRIAETIDAFYGDSGAKDGVSRSYKQAVEDLDAETVKALDGPYRTTVLEPINRFCAYFPDINECIKKRNHKMLDYDAMRAKVRKLTEKPDKDPAKLPRADKDAEMVSMKQFLDEAAHTPEPDLTVPSPPKVLENLVRKRRAEGEADFTTASEGEELLLSEKGRRVLDREILRERRKSGLVHRSPSMLKRLSRIKSRRLDSGLEDTLPQRRASVLTTSPSLRLPKLRNSSQEALLQRSDSSISKRALSGPKTSLLQRSNTRKSLTPSILLTPSNNNNRPAARSTSRGTSSFSSKSIKLARSHWLNPSELEDLMAPLREQYVRMQTDAMQQAKVAYDQLNEQLTDELPKLIDLRVPYLDPSFEALVKIQLRFCAEAYSRMAQVQQYLDASTRDQYASGELDARVEDVLGQIRELSIAGTV